MPTPSRISLFLTLIARLPLAAVCLVALGVSGYALDGVRFKTWNTANGLPQNSVQAIAQTPDGYLWLATYDGLARFDGVRFKVFQKSNTPELPTNRLAFVSTDSLGRLWIFPEASPHIVLYENGSFRSFDRGSDYEFDGFPDFWVEGGATRFTGKGGDFVYDAGKFTRRPSSRPRRDIGIDASSNIWIDDGQNFYSIREGIVSVHPRNADNPLTLAQTIALATHNVANHDPAFDARNAAAGHVRDGDAFWFFQVIGGKRHLVRFRDGKLDVSGFSYISPSALARDRSGNLWIATLEEGIFTVDAWSLKTDDLSELKVERLTTGEGLANSTIACFFVDRSNNFWIGGAGGLQLVRNKPIVDVLDENSGLPSHNIYAVAEDTTGSIWFGAWGQSVVRYRNGTVDGYDISLVSAITFDRTGRAVVAGDGNVWRFDDSGFKEMVLEDFKYDPDDPLRPVEEISFISYDRAGDLWIGGSSGLLRYRDNVRKRFTVADGLPSENIVAFLESRDGAIWIGTRGGLARLNGDRFTAFRKSDGMGGDFVRSLYEDADGTLWIGTYDSGIIRYKGGKFRTIAAKDGLFNDGVFCILEDNNGWFWMNSNKGIYRTRRQELNDFADGRISSVTSAAYGPEDGLLNVEGNGGKQPAGLRSSDGRLWFPTAGGLAVIDPTRVQVDEHAPDVLIEEIKIDQKELTTRTQGIVLDPEQKALEINYTGIKFDNPERLQFRYRLEGLDEEWTEAGTRRTAYFTHLPYGEYTFHVLAANRDGIWNQQGASIKILVDRPFHRTIWFYGLVSLIVAGFVGATYYNRVTHIAEKAEARQVYARQLLESQEKERSRIAMELHDSIGQSLVVIRNRALLGLSKRDSGEAMFDQLQEISDASATALQETREIAHTLHPYQIEALGLTSALLSLIDRVEGSSEIDFAVDISPYLGDVPRDIAIAIYRITQEWLTNIVKYASARNVSVSLRPGSPQLVLEISDDGVGFDLQTVRKGLGLKGIEERSRMVNADLSINSKPGSGATLKLIVDRP